MTSYKRFIEKVLQLIHNNTFLLLILTVAFMVRILNLQELFLYGHDNDLAGWFIKDVLINHHPRLVGQETSTPGIFIGPLFYYLQIPFYLLTGMDPIGVVLLTALLGTFTGWSIYFVFAQIWDKQSLPLRGGSVGLLGASIYAISFYTVLGDREVVPTMPVILWTVWFLYGIWCLFKGNQKTAWPTLGILLGLIWHLNFALVLLTPLVLVAFAMQKNSKVGTMGKNELRIKNYELWIGTRVLNLKAFCVGIVAFIFLSLPLFAFEFRHDFQQSHSLWTALTTDQHDIISGVDKFARTFHLASKNVSSLLGVSIFDGHYEWVHGVLLIVFLVLLFKKIIEWRFGALMILWLSAFVAFFSIYSKVLSEYYLNGMIIIYIALLSLTLSHLIQSKRWKWLAVSLFFLFVSVHVYRLITIPINRSGYLYRKNVIAEIKRDSDARGYPCVSISYITDPGNNLGYRYFIWHANLKTKPISNNVPVYTIVFPLNPIFGVDMSIGAIGLIYPDYNRYNKETVVKSCEGDDWNLEEPMFRHPE
jgi:hypothetical protein